MLTDEELKRFEKQLDKIWKRHVEQGGSLECECGTTTHGWPKHADWCKAKPREKLWAPSGHEWHVVISPVATCLKCGLECEIGTPRWRIKSTSKCVKP